jgi:hypothetical protein
MCQSKRAPHLNAGVAGKQRHEVALHRLAAIQTGLCAHLQPASEWHAHLSRTSCRHDISCWCALQHIASVPAAMHEIEVAMGSSYGLHTAPADASRVDAVLQHQRMHGAHGQRDHILAVLAEGQRFLRRPVISWDCRSHGIQRCGSTPPASGLATSLGSSEQLSTLPTTECNV